MGARTSHNRDISVPPHKIQNITHAINNACCTVTENKPSNPHNQQTPRAHIDSDLQMQQSVTLAFAAVFFSFILPADVADGDSGTPPSARSCFIASLLSEEGFSKYSLCEDGLYVLEIVLPTLPLSSNLDLHLDATIHLFRSALIVYAKLDYIAVLRFSLVWLGNEVRENTLMGYGRDSVFGFESRI
jgi:hypothetical protein